jgi:hypothetical protein
MRSCMNARRSSWLSEFSRILMMPAVV